MPGISDEHGLLGLLTVHLAVVDVKLFSLHSCLLINKGLCSDITYVPPCLVRAAGLIANDKRPNALLMKFT